MASLGQSILKKCLLDEEGAIKKATLLNLNDDLEVFTIIL